MQSYSPLHLAIGLTLALLSFATALTWVLHIQKPKNNTLAKVKIIIKSWWVIAGAFFIAISLGFWGVFSLFALVSVYGLMEYVRISNLPFKKTLFIVIALGVLSPYLSLYAAQERFFLASPIILIIWLCPLVVIIHPSVERYTATVASTIGIILITHCLAHVPALMRFHLDLWNDNNSAALASLAFIFLVQINDVFQFLNGKLFGKRKITPEISPNKTEAGFIGGAILSSLLGGVLFSKIIGLSFFLACILGLALSLTGMLGDLMFSGFKRYLGVKDFSTLLPGHGGLLDRLDSLVLTAPVFYYFITFFKN